MALTKIQAEQVTTLMDKYLEENRPAEDIRAKLDLGWRFESQSIIVFEIRPAWNDSGKILNLDNAKATWIQRSNEWHVFWKRASGKWDRYPPLSAVKNLQRFIIELEKDPNGCFWG